MIKTAADRRPPPQTVSASVTRTLIILALLCAALTVAFVSTSDFTYGWVEEPAAKIVAGMASLGLAMLPILISLLHETSPEATAGKAKASCSIARRLNRLLSVSDSIHNWY